MVLHMIWKSDFKDCCQYLALMHKPKELSHLLRAIKVVFSLKAVRLYWSVLLDQWSSVDSYRNLHC